MFSPVSKSPPRLVSGVNCHVILLTCFFFLPNKLKTAQQQGNEVVTWQLLNGAVLPKYKTNKFLTALLLCYELKILKLNPRTQPSLSSLTLMNSDHRIGSATCSCIVNPDVSNFIEGSRSAPRRQQRRWRVFLFSMALFLYLFLDFFLSGTGLEFWIFFIGFAGAFVVWICWGFCSKFFFSVWGFVAGRMFGAGFC